MFIRLRSVHVSFRVLGDYFLDTFVAVPLVVKSSES